MLFGNGWDYGIGFVVFEVYNGDYVYICMFYNGEDVEYRDVKGILRMGIVLVYVFNNYKI